MTDEVVEKLAQLLEQDQFELIFQEAKVRLVYLMNDAVESFLVFKNVRITGEYNRDYQGELEASLEKQGQKFVLIVRQGETVFTLFFDDLVMENHLYEYGTIGHFWVKNYEYLRQMEYRLAILRDKYDYLGEEYCNEKEKRLAQLVDFPPLNYCCYPAVPEKYIVPKENPWVPTEAALSVMDEFASRAKDRTLGKILRLYREFPVPFIAKRIGNMLHRNSHGRVVDMINEEIRVASKKYPRRNFGRDAECKIQETLHKVQRRQELLKNKGQQSIILREEPFSTAEDSIEYKIYLMIWKKGILNRKVLIEEYPVSL
ncbi:DUF3878 family protein [Blautia sp. HCP28S3_G10]|uniref:DUF3878 family protein n=1 Tax=Blautia sp. HCP28S3_G10 TaxID=3438908 RepID=UPI003F8CD068